MAQAASRKLKAAMRGDQLAFDFGIAVVDADEARRARKRESMRRARAANPEKFSERNRQWRAANPAKGREYRAANPEKFRERDRQRRAANPEKFSESNRRRRARKRGNGVYLVTQRDLARLLNRQGGTCAWCDASEDFHLDHIIPIARGGAHSIGNLQYLCAPHNLSKNKRTRTEWLKRNPQPTDGRP